MGLSAIEWTHYTKNLWWGCKEVSPECDHCYARELSENPRFGGDFKVWGNDAPRRFLTQQIDDVLAWDRKAAKEGERRRVFWQSMGDFLERRPDLAAPRALAIDAIERTPHLDHLILTKLPQNFSKLLPGDWFANPRAHIWGGVTCGLDKSLWRVAELVKLPFAVRFVSYEPALGPVDFGPYLHLLDWEIDGGESGKSARPPNPQWFRNHRDACVAAGVAYLFKQWGAWSPVPDRRGRKHVDAPAGDGSHHRMFRVGKKKAGRLFEGREWSQFPTPRVVARAA